MIVFLFLILFTSVAFGATELDVSGVFIDDKGGAAIINGVNVSTGEMVGDAKVVKVTKEGVVFQREGQLFFQPLRDANPNIVTQKPKPVTPQQAAAATAPSAKPTALPNMPTIGLVDAKAVKQTLQKIDELKAVSAERGKMADQFMDDMKSGSPAQ